jgi:hypothetical protein
MQYRLLCALMMIFASHAPRCSHGHTPLKIAITNGRMYDVIAFLRSVGAPE